MPRWSLTHGRGQVEVIEADRIEVDDNGWSWWTVVVVIHEPWWACVRRAQCLGHVGRTQQARLEPGSTPRWCSGKGAAGAVLDCPLWTF